LATPAPDYTPLYDLRRILAEAGVEMTPVELAKVLVSIAADLESEGGQERVQRFFNNIEGLLRHPDAGDVLRHVLEKDRSRQRGQA